MHQSADNTPQDDYLAAPLVPPLPPPPPSVVAVSVAAAGRPFPSSVLVCGVALYKDALFCIFRHLDALTLMRAARVCRLFALMGREDSLWKRLSTARESQFASSFRTLKRDGLQFSFTGAERKQCFRRVQRLKRSEDMMVTCSKCCSAFLVTRELIVEQLSGPTIAVLGVAGPEWWDDLWWCKTCYAKFGICECCGFRTSICLADVIVRSDRYISYCQFCERCHMPHTAPP